ncbi:MAG: HlyD family efflux transporter periplasmic adaptor subunit [Gemmatimonadales bacterium]|nr:HlyD family efflux transporter periplasmic adaptor subunit [Gemmatimonadales bacterium]
MQVLEGTRVTAGTPLLRIRSLGLERELVALRRITDSLANRSAQARGRERFSEAAQVDAARSGEEATLAGLGERVHALRIRALGTGVVVTPRPEELVGRWVSTGEILIQLGRSDSVEIRIALSGAGGTLVRSGHPVRLLQDATLNAPVSARIAAVAVAIDSGQALTARLRLAAGTSLRPGMTGRARITLQRSNVWGAVWWAFRRGIRSDICSKSIAACVAGA